MLAGLQSGPIFRLSQTWRLVAKRDKATFERLCELLSADDNWWVVVSVSGGGGGSVSVSSVACVSVGGGGVSGDVGGVCMHVILDNNTPHNHELFMIHPPFYIQ